MIEVICFDDCNLSSVHCDVTLAVFSTDCRCIHSPSSTELVVAYTDRKVSSSFSLFLSNGNEMSELALNQSIIREGVLKIFSNSNCDCN